MEKYIEAVIEGRSFLPKIGDGTTHYDIFVELFERVYKFCGGEARPALGKPVFLTDEEYEKAVYHFVYEKRWALGLSDLLVVDDVPKLFSIIKEDDELMKELIYPSLHNFGEASLALMLCGQTKRIPDKLAKLVFGRSGLFYGLVEPKVVPGNEYYSSMIELGILPKVMIHCRNYMSTLPRLLTSLTLSFKGNPEKIDQIERSVTREFMGLHDLKQEEIRQCFEPASFRSLIASRGYSTEDFEFSRGVMVRCGLWNESKA